MAIFTLVFAAHPIAASIYTPAPGITVNVDLTSQSKYYITVDVLWGLNFDGLVVNTGQQEFNTPTLLLAQQSGQQIGGWQTFSLGNGTWALANPYENQTGSLPTGLFSDTPIKVTYTYWLSNQFGQVLNTNNWIFDLYAQSQPQYGLTSAIGTPEPGTFAMLAAGSLLLMCRLLSSR